MDFKMEALTSFAGLAIVGTVFGAVVRGWGSVKAFIGNIVGLLVVHVGLEDQHTSRLVLSYLVKNRKRSRVATMTFGGRYESLKDGKFGHIPYESFGGRTTLFWDGWVPIWFKVTMDKGSDKQIVWGTPEVKTNCSIIYLRWMIDVEVLVKQASAESNELAWSSSKVYTRFFIKRIPDALQVGMQKYSAGTAIAWYQTGTCRLLSHTPEDLGRSTLTQGRAIDNLYFPPVVDKLIQEIEMWRKLRDWYAERGIPWKRGWVLYGPPGTGKSAVARAIAEDLDMPLFVYALGVITNDDLEKSWAEMQSHVPCIALFEDFDNVFHGRENVYNKPTISDVVTANALAKSDDTSVFTNMGRLSFDCLLNCLDGVEKSNGIFTIITTNHIEKLDVAMGQPRKNEDGSVDFISTRPGRIDKAIELGYMRDQDKIKLAKRIFFDNEEGFVTMKEMIAAEPNKQETPAQFQERCAQLALRMIWEKEHAAPKEVVPLVSSNGCVKKVKV